MKIKKGYVWILVIVGLLYSAYWIVHNTFHATWLSEAKLDANVDGKFITNLIGKHLEQFPDVGVYYLKRIEQEDTQGVEPWMYDKDGKLILYFYPKSKQSEEIKIKISYFNKSDYLYKNRNNYKNIEKVYDSVCHRKNFENCTSILIDNTILNYPEILQSILQIIKNPCEGAVSYKDDAKIKDYYCKDGKDIFGKVLLGLVNDKNDLTEIMVVIRDAEALNGN